MAKTRDEILKNIRLSLLAYKDIFEQGIDGQIQNDTHEEQENKTEKQIEFFFPKRILLDTIGGYKLKDNQGYITIKETYAFKNSTKFEDSKIEYIYRYTGHEGTEYFCMNGKGAERDSFPYYFHYDRDLPSPGYREPHPDNHLQVLHNVPRFISAEMDLDRFLEHIKETFYQHDLKPFPKAIFER